MNKQKIAYYISKGFLSLIMLFSAGMYLFNNAEVQTAYTSLGYPTHLIYPLAIAKILGVVAIWSNKSEVLKQFAYAGFFYVSVLGLTAHIVVNDGMWQGAGLSLVAVVIAYYLEKKKSKK